MWHCTFPGTSLSNLSRTKYCESYRVPWALRRRVIFLWQRDIFDALLSHNSDMFVAMCLGDALKMEFVLKCALYHHSFIQQDHREAFLRSCHSVRPWHHHLCLHSHTHTLHCILPLFRLLLAFVRHSLLAAFVAMLAFLRYSLLAFWGNVYVCFRGNSVQREGRMSYAEFVWFLISEEDKKNPTR